MIQRAFITEWRPNAPWALDAQVEQDLVLSRVLIEIFSDPLLARELAVRGGTALHKLVLAPATRYSEDIDLVQRVASPIGPVLDALRARLDPWLGKPQRKQGAGRATLFYRFESETPPITPLRLKVEINTREHFSELGFVEHAFSVEGRWFAGRATVTTYVIEELLGTKLRALYQRKKGRDLFDLDLALRRLPKLDPDQLIRCFAAYMKHAGAAASRAEFEANLAEKARDAAFTADLRPLLSASAEPYDPHAGLDRVLKMLISRLPGEPWKLSPT